VTEAGFGKPQHNHRLNDHVILEASWEEGLSRRCYIILNDVACARTHGIIYSSPLNAKARPPPTHQIFVILTLFNPHKHHNLSGHEQTVPLSGLHSIHRSAQSMSP